MSGQSEMPSERQNIIEDQRKRRSGRCILSGLLVLISLLLTGVLLINALSIRIGHAGPGAAEPALEDKGDYGVFLSVDGAATDSLRGYELLVIDAQNFSKEELGRLKETNGAVYTYLNVGALESFREYYEKYSVLGLGAYENWEEEIWMDVSDKDWRSFVAGKLAGDLLDKGADGFFVDNLDVYYEYPGKPIYEGIVEILEALKEWGKPVIVNGGDVFIRDYMERETSPIADLIRGVNQETVLTAILFSEGRLGRQEPDNTEYFKEYLQACRREGLAVYVLEYTKDKALEREVREYCERENFICYISDSIELDAK